MVHHIMSWQNMMILNQTVLFFFFFFFFFFCFYIYYYYCYLDVLWLLNGIEYGIQDPSLATTFNLDQFYGPPYYELAKHDDTQPNSFVFFSIICFVFVLVFFNDIIIVIWLLNMEFKTLLLWPLLLI